MVSLATFVRRAPDNLLLAHFARSGIPVPDSISNSKEAKGKALGVVRLIEGADDLNRLRFLQDADRISAMADQAGQTALYGVTGHRQKLDALESGQARAHWMFLNE